MARITVEDCLEKVPNRFKLVHMAAVLLSGGLFLLRGLAVQGGYEWLAVIGVLMSAVSLFYYLRVVKTMTMSPDRAGRVPFKNAVRESRSSSSRRTRRGEALDRPKR